MAILGEKQRKTREKAMKTANKNDTKGYLVAHELKLARVLAGNNKVARDRALKALKKWFMQRSSTLPFTESDFQRIWKGLFYAMWMSDKPLVQEECAENISNLIHFPVLKDSLQFFKAGMTILINEWFGIDQLRLDKFLMLVRRMLRQMFFALKKHGLSKENIGLFSEVLSTTILNTQGTLPIGLFMHFTEIFLEEFAKVTKGNIDHNCFIELLRPFIKKLAVTDDRRQTAHIRKFIFTYLIRQSNLGLEYQAKYEAWKREGFPGTIDSMQKVKLDPDEVMSSDDEIQKSEVRAEKPLDPRAGRVNVELPQIQFNPKLITTGLLEHKFDKNSNAKSRKLMSILAEQFTKLSNGIYPLGVKKVIDDKKDSYDTSLRKATNRLVKFEKKLMGRDRKRKRKNKNKEENVDEVKRRKFDEDISDQSNQEEEKLVKKKGQDNVIQENNKKKQIKKDLINSKVKNKKPVDSNPASSKKDKAKANAKKISKDKIENQDGELAEFIKKSEGEIKEQIKNGLAHNSVEKKKNKKKVKDSQVILESIECVFERNSGTWIVFDTRKEKGKTKKPSQQLVLDGDSFKSVNDVKQIPSESSENPLEHPRTHTKNKKDSSNNSKTVEDSSKTSKSGKTKEISKTKSSPLNSPDQNGSPKSGLNPVKLFESPPKQTELFPKSEWDEPLQEGEYEICIPSRKYIKRMKKVKTNQSLHEIVNISSKLRGKSRHSLSSSLIKDPFSTPTSEKKVKINTRLNKSQEIHEHLIKIRNSPGIPYDANKKPSKPLLKSGFTSTPINPFYKQLNIC